jgi:UDP-N-acetylglucosamine pyrophosphorylase
MGFNSVFKGLIPDLKLNQKRHRRMGPIGNGSGFMSLKKTVNKLEKSGALCIY